MDVVAILNIYSSDMNHQAPRDSVLIHVVLFGDDIDYIYLSDMNHPPRDSVLIHVVLHTIW